MVSSSATIHKPRYSRERSAGFSWGTLLHFLGIALHVLTPTSEAFAANACTSRRPIFSPIQHVTNDRLKNECLHPSLQHQRRLKNTPVNTRPFLSQFHYNMASTTTGMRKSSNAGSNTNNNNQDEVPWQCVIDPHCCDECLEFMNLHQPGMFHKDEEKITKADKVSLTVIGLAGLLAFSLLLTLSGPGSWRFFLAGGLCAASSHAIPTPIDVVKTKQQVDSDLQGLNFVQATKKIIKDEGVGTLVAGLGPTIWGYLLEGSCKFGVYEVLKPVVKRIMGSLAAATNIGILNSQIIAFMICGCIAGTSASIVLAPMEALRIRLVSEPDFAPKGWIQGGRRMIRKEGVLGMWRGLLPQIYKQVPYTVTKNVSFDFFTTFAYGAVLSCGFAMNHTTKFAVPFLSAICASILSCISSQPGDMLLSLVSAHQGEFRTTNEIARDILRSDRGVRGFFVGLNGRLVHVGITVTLQLVLYDFLKRLCGGIATGAH